MVAIGGAPKCPRCAQNVYAAEKIVGPNNSSWHKLCFSCKDCRKRVDSTTASEHDGEVYCRSCYGRAYGPKGYGFAGGHAFLSMDHPPLNGNEEGKETTTTTNPSMESTTYMDIHKPIVERRRSNTKVPEGCCLRCGQSVFHAEEVLFTGQKWHRLCFRCATCNTLLDSTKAGDHEGEAYCRSCHGKQFGPKGYGFAGGHAFLNTDNTAAN